MPKCAISQKSMAITIIRLKSGPEAKWRCPERRISCRILKAQIEKQKRLNQIQPEAII